jgi:hypothetical protein
MFWTIDRFPELDHLDPDQRAAVLARVPWWTYPLVAAAAFVPAFLTGIFVTAYAARYGPTAMAAVAALPVAAAVRVGLYAFQMRRVRVAMRRAIAEGFRGRRPPFCLGCGYDLRASDDAARCPECGGALPPAGTPG